MYQSLTLPLLATLFFHGVILAFIIIDAPEPEPLVKRAKIQYIKAELVTIDKPKAKPVTPVTIKPKKTDDTAQKAALASKKKIEQQRKIKQAKAEQQKVVELQKKERYQKELQQQERQKAKRLAEQRRLKEQQDKDFADAIAQENAESQRFNDTGLANSYIALITEVIESNWNRPPSARNSMEVVLAIQMVPTGEVVSVRVLNGSGNSAFDRSAENAVLKAERFPELQQLPSRIFEANFRRLRLKFRPEDLRL
jgi:colicin import membrane protein|tara:strand:- start:3755 stop:4513 length:759 start_codon:yes stop_codon:yes gene_type:complete